MIAFKKVGDVRPNNADRFMLVSRKKQILLRPESGEQEKKGWRK